MDSAKYVAQHKRINIGKKIRVKCAIQYTVDLINNNNINRDVLEEYANRL